MVSADVVVRKALRLQGIFLARESKLRTELLQEDTQLKFLEKNLAILKETVSKLKYVKNSSFDPSEYYTDGLSKRSRPASSASNSQRMADPGYIYKKISTQKGAYPSTHRENAFLKSSSLEKKSKMRVETARDKIPITVFTPSKDNLAHPDLTFAIQQLSGRKKSDRNHSQDRNYLTVANRDYGYNRKYLNPYSRKRRTSSRSFQESSAEFINPACSRVSNLSKSPKTKKKGLLMIPSKSQKLRELREPREAKNSSPVRSGSQLLNNGNLPPTPITTPKNSILCSGPLQQAQGQPSSKKTKNLVRRFYSPEMKRNRDGIDSTGGSPQPHRIERLKSEENLATNKIKLREKEEQKKDFFIGSFDNRSSKMALSKISKALSQNGGEVSDYSLLNQINQIPSHSERRLRSGSGSGLKTSELRSPPLRHSIVVPTSGKAITILDKVERVNLSNRDEKEKVIGQMAPPFLNLPTTPTKRPDSAFNPLTKNLLEKLGSASRNQRFKSPENNLATRQKKKERMGSPTLGFLKRAY